MIELLVSLQVLDQALRTKTLRVAELEGRVAALEEAFQAQHIAATAARQEFDALTAKQRDLEGNLQVAESRLKDRRMRINRVRNDKELSLAKREVEIFRDEVNTFETELVEVMEQAETLGAKVEGLEGELGRVSAARAAESQSARDTVKTLKREVEVGRGERGKLITDIDATLRHRYETIFSRRGGLAVVEIRQGICQGCRMHVPPQLFNEIQRNPEQVSICPSCQRMLFWRPEDEAASG